MHALDKILTSLNTTLTKGGIEVTNKRCEHCKKRLQIKNGQEFCFHCEFVEAEDKQKAKEYKQNFDQAKVLDIFKEESLINPRLKECTFSNYAPSNEDLTRAKTNCMKYAEEFNPKAPDNLMLLGTYGVGKSHLAISILKRVLIRSINSEDQWTGIFISMPKLMTKLKSTYNRFSAHSEDELLDTLAKVDLLVLDDVGAELTDVDDGDVKANSWALKKMFEIVDGRIGKSTIFTTNFSFEKLMSLYGERNFSRMMENTRTLEMKGDNYRLKQFKK
ncbi:ATP-binding protein [Priestia megaterium]|uniref:ATP-binding protein n=1 Tax=Priestia megaterium TaxID=1404 RepID=UPI000BFA10E4|nr:ATP-binding protein [Priestia megaterium]PFI93388.1 hypothetical protein COI84_19675 [Priestia megaterium]PGR11795.1 hypothetical protein COC62_14325 [Priestia megaterium]